MLKLMSIRLPSDVIARLDAAADRERRTRSNLVLVILEQWLTAHQPAPTPPPASGPPPKRPPVAEPPDERKW